MRGWGSTHWRDLAVALPMVGTAARAAAPGAPTFAHTAGVASELVTFALAAIAATLVVLLMRRVRPAGAERPVADAQPAPAGVPRDSVTGLPDRAGAIEHLQRCLDRRGDASDAGPGVLLIDLDGFGLVNASLGHDAGDEVLRHAGERVARALREPGSAAPGGWLARVGGDEFIALIDGPDAPGRAVRAADRIRTAVSEPLVIGGHEVGLTATIGIAHASAGCRRAEQLLRDAGIALSRARGAGRARHAVFEPSMGDAARERLALEAALRRAIESRAIRVLYQPVVDLATGRLTAFEALARWCDPVRGVVSPSRFIPVAEETGLIIPLGALVLEDACARLAEWSGRGVEGGCPAVNVNVSRRQLLDPGFLPSIQRAVRDLPGGPSLLRLEVTESAIMTAPEAILDVLNQFSKLGFQLQMDDFGIGLSSLVSLKKFPFDVLKIDQEFVRDLARGREYMAIMHAVVSLAHNLGMGVTAEGVETAEQFAVTAALACDFAQGYLFSPAVPAEEAGALIGRTFRIDPAAAA